MSKTVRFKWIYKKYKYKMFHKHQFILTVCCISVVKSSWIWNQTIYNNNNNKHKGNLKVGLVQNVLFSNSSVNIWGKLTFTSTCSLTQSSDTRHFCSETFYNGSQSIPLVNTLGFVLALVGRTMKIPSVWYTTAVFHRGSFWCKAHPWWKSRGQKSKNPY